MVATPLWYMPAEGLWAMDLQYSRQDHILYAFGIMHRQTIPCLGQRRLPPATLLNG